MMQFLLQEVHDSDISNNNIINNTTNNVKKDNSKSKWLLNDDSKLEVSSSKIEIKSINSSNSTIIIDKNSSIPDKIDNDFSDFEIDDLNDILLSKPSKIKKNNTNTNLKLKTTKNTTETSNIPLEIIIDTDFKLSTDHFSYEFNYLILNHWINKQKIEKRNNNTKPDIRKNVALHSLLHDYSLLSFNKKNGISFIESIKNYHYLLKSLDILIEKETSFDRKIKKTISSPIKNGNTKEKLNILHKEMITIKNTIKLNKPIYDKIIEKFLMLNHSNILNYAYEHKDQFKIISFELIWFFEFEKWLNSNLPLIKIFYDFYLNINDKDRKNKLKILNDGINKFLEPLPRSSYKKKYKLLFSNDEKVNSRLKKDFRKEFLINDSNKIITEKKIDESEISKKHIVFDKRGKIEIRNKKVNERKNRNDKDKISMKDKKSNNNNVNDTKKSNEKSKPKENNTKNIAKNDRKENIDNTKNNTKENIDNTKNIDKIDTSDNTRKNTTRTGRRRRRKSKNNTSSQTENPKPVFQFKNVNK